MRQGYAIENRVPEKGIHFGILVYNWGFLNVVQNAPIIENSSMLLDKSSVEKIGLWKIKKN